MSTKRIIFPLLLFAYSHFLDAQNIQKENFHSPKRASVYSAIIPGYGQFYNKKYWKIPIVYASIGTSFFIARWNQNKYLIYKEALHYRTDQDINTIDEFENMYSEANLITIKNYHRKNRDLAYIISAGFYFLNIIDASVDAHLFNFTINEDITLNVAPSMVDSSLNFQAVLSLTLNLN
tara:strand:- start:1306 stop:1839 length:534 start_codon:yes stop_codon:yes gene_type:complete